MIGRKEPVFFFFEIVRRSCCPKFQRGNVFFLFGLNLVNRLSGFAGTDYDQSCCLWVKSTRMANF